MSTADGVSLVIPSYRRGVRIADTLRSIASQTRPPDEVIVVNDGGWSETTAFVQAEFPTYRVLDVEQGGATRTRNRGAAAARHPILMFLDDDDTLLPDAVEILSGVLKTFPEARAAYADHTYTNHITGEHFPDHHSANPAFHRLRAISPLASRGDVRLYGRELYVALLSGNLLQQPWMIYKADFERLGGFLPDLHAANDWEFYLRIVRGGLIALSDRVISHHIVEPGRPHLTLSPKLMDAQMEAARHHLALVGWGEPRAQMVLRKKLALAHKTIGDRAVETSLWEAWRHYVKALAWWPFDAVVLMRSLGWPFRALVRGHSRERQRSK